MNALEASKRLCQEVYVDGNKRSDSNSENSNEMNKIANEIFQPALSAPTTKRRNVARVKIDEGQNKTYMISNQDQEIRKENPAEEIDEDLLLSRFGIESNH